MKYIKRKNLELSKIGFGTGRLGTKVGIEDSFEMLDMFLKYGGNVIDTARNYYEWVENGRGKSEETIGKWMIKNNVRDKVFISTKGGVKNVGRQFFINLERNNLIQEIKESQDALQTEKINLYLLHRDEPARAVEEIMDTMQIIADVAHVEQLGVCNWEVGRVRKANHYARKNNLKPLSIIQTYWSLAEYTNAMWNDDTTTHMDEEMHQYIKENDFIAMAFTSQAKGFFQKAIERGLENVDEFLKKRIVTPANLHKLEYIKKYCQDNQVASTAVVNSYITSYDIDAIALVSCSNLSQMIDIMENCDYKISESVIREIDKSG